MMQWFSVILALLSCIQIICSGTVLHHITSIECPVGESCLTLSTLAANVSNYSDSNTTLIFLAGNHTLDSGFTISNITFLRLSTNYSELSVITCSARVQIKFVHITQMQIHNLNFIGCNSLVQFVPQFVLEGSNFHAIKDYGSALNLDQTNAASIVNSSFTFNTVGTHKENVDSPFSSRIGGALVISESNLTIYRSQFIGNAAQLGGAIFVERHSHITINNSVFADNSAEDCYAYSNSCYGGAIFIDNSCIVTAHNNTFVNNTAESYGGAIALFQATYTDLHNVFHFNGAYYRGGVIYAFNSNITVSGSYYISNQVAEYGATISAQNNSQLMIVNSVFNSNYAGNGGGVISVYFNSIITAYNSSFDDNEAAILAGVVYAITSCFITVNRCSFNSNKAIYGGVVYAEGNSRLTAESSSFSNNLATHDVGVFIAISSNITLNKSFFTDNRAVNDVGVLYATDQYDVTINNSFFRNSKAGAAGGIIYVYSYGKVAIRNSSFLNNEADFDGGVAFADDFCNISFENCTFLNNTAFNGGVIVVHNAFFEDFGSTYIGNRANINGGTITLNKGNIVVRSSTFINNTAKINGGVLYTPFHRYEHTIVLQENNFESNKAGGGGVIALFNRDFLEMMVNNNEAKQGGVIYLYSGNTVTIEDGSFSNNSASSDGGVIHLVEQNSLTISNSALDFNSAGLSGGVLYSLSQNEITIIGDSCTFIGNQAHSGGVFHAKDSKVNIKSHTLLLEKNTATDTGGAMYLSNTNFTLCAGNNIIMRNRAKTGGALFVIETSVNIQSNNTLIANNSAAGNGGGMWLSKSQLTLLNGNNELVENKAESGGGVYASRSRLLVVINSFIQINSNTAMFAGGGLYLTSSTLDVQQNTLYITENRADEVGGGLHAANSSIIIKGVLHCANNQAKNGGGFSLERYTKLHGKSAENDGIDFTSNIASSHGGALYIDDETNPDMCAIDTLQNVISKTEHCFLDSLFIDESDNFAGKSGSNLFGGLLDRCRVQSEFSETSVSGLANFQRLSNASLDTISSHPVRMCFCRESQPDCDYQPESIQVRKQMAFSVELIAYDHINHTVNATISSSLNSSAGGLGEGQGTQHINGECTKLEFTIFSPLASEVLMLTLRGPCSVTGISERSIRIEVKCKCPIGFQISNNDEIACVCICDQVLQPYTRTECNTTTQSIIRRDGFWITYINHTNSSGYIIYPYCPFDYCHPPAKQVSVNLNLPHGSNAQCASHRSGILCGSCEPGYSVSLGSSRCLQCPSYWPGLVATIVVVFILSGIALVVVLLVLNLTVAIGTINAVIFYANVMAASKSALFPSGVSFASVFISLLNFDLGFDMCFFDGMDTYVKTWLQLAFPAYIIFLVALIIKLSYHYTWFGCLIGKKDPVATLATLILLSYTKLLQTIITSFSSAALTYPDGSRKTIWLPDASIEYFTLKHALLFCIAILVLLLGLAYTLLLFTWQWVLRLPRNRVKWIRNLKLRSFLEIYHVSYAPKHRYWTGLLLFIRVSVYLISAFNPSADPRLTLLSTTFIVCLLFLYIAIFGVWIYKNWYINAMETLTYFNVIAVSVVTLYSLGNADVNQTAVTNVSVAIIFAQLMVVIFYHAYIYTMLSNIQRTNIYKKMCTKFQSRYQKRLDHKPPPVENNIHQFHVLLDMIDHPVNTNDYNIPQVNQEPAEPTHSVIELPKPHLAPLAPLDKIPEESELESGSHQHLSERVSSEDDLTIKKMDKQSALTDKCLGHCSGIKTTECNDSITSIETVRAENSTMVEEKSIAKRHSLPRVKKNSVDDQGAMNVT